MADEPWADLVGSVGKQTIDKYVEFAYLLRLEGLAVGSDDVLGFCSALAELSPSDLQDVYWCGRISLVNRVNHIPIYDRVFQNFFLDLPAEAQSEQKKNRRLPQGSTGTINVPDAEPGDRNCDEPPLVLGLQASTLELQRRKRFSACSEAELAALRRIINKIRLEPPRRKTRRYQASSAGKTLDIRRLARETMGLKDTSPALYHMQRKEKPRPVVLLLDISGSMADHSRNLLQFGYSMRRAAQKVEVFCFGTRLTRITPLLDRRNPDTAMRLAAERVLDWDGGTRIGDSIDSFVKHWARRGLARSAIVVICSDGLDRGSPVTLAESMERLERLCHRIIWLNPLHGEQTVTAPSLALTVVEPYIDESASGHNLASLEDFAQRLAHMR